MELTALLKRRFWLLWVTVCLTTCTLGGCFAAQAYGVMAGDMEHIGDRRLSFVLSTSLGLAAGVIMGGLWCRFMWSKTARRELDATFERQNTNLSVMMIGGASVGIHLIAWIIMESPKSHFNSFQRLVFVGLYVTIVPALVGLLIGKGFSRWWKMTADHVFNMMENPSIPVRPHWRFGWLIIIPCLIGAGVGSFLGDLLISVPGRIPFSPEGACLGGIIGVVAVVLWCSCMRHVLPFTDRKNAGSRGLMFGLLVTWLASAFLCLGIGIFGEPFVIGFLPMGFIPAGIFGMIFGSGLVCLIPNSEFCEMIPEKESLQTNTEAGNGRLE